MLNEADFFPAVSELCWLLNDVTTLLRHRTIWRIQRFWTVGSCPRSGEFCSWCQKSIWPNSSFASSASICPITTAVRWPGVKRPALKSESRWNCYWRRTKSSSWPRRCVALCFALEVYIPHITTLIVYLGTHSVARYWSRSWVLGLFHYKTWRWWFLTSAT